jgi:hypothetical protein
MDVLRNNEAHSCNHCCSGKAISIIHSECVFIALVILREIRIPHVVICGLSGSKILSHIIS